MRRLAAVLIIALTWPAAPLHARKPLPLQPATKWVLEYAEENCRLARKFGQGDQQVTLVLDQFEPGDSFKMILVGGLVAPRHASGVVTGKLRFGPHEEVAEFSAERGSLGGQRAIILHSSQRLAPLTKAEKAASERAHCLGGLFEEPPIGVAREAAATWLEVTKGLKRDVRLETGSMGEPLAALRKCSWDTVKHWGLDPQQQQTLGRKLAPKTGPASWLHSADYPRKALYAGYTAS